MLARGTARGIMLAALVGILSTGAASAIEREKDAEAVALAAETPDCDADCPGGHHLQSAQASVGPLKLVTDASFEADVLKSARPVLVNYWAEWCGPCRQIMPSLIELAGELNDRLTIVNLNIDNDSATPRKYGVRSVPTLMLFKDGRLVATKVGAMPKNALDTRIRSSL